jgi:hypothetical protein
MLGACSVEPTGLAKRDPVVPASPPVAPTAPPSNVPPPPSPPPPMLPDAAVAPEQRDASAAVDLPAPDLSPAPMPDAAAPDLAPPAVDDRPGSCPPSPDLTLCLRFEDALADGSPQRASLDGEGVSFTSGPTGRAASLSPGSRITVPSIEVLGPGGGSTLEVWLRPTMLGRRMVVLDGPYRLTILASGSAMCSVGGEYALNTDSVSAGVWTSLACTFDGTTITLWVGGKSVRRGALTQSIPASARALIGMDMDGGSLLNAQIDNLRVWKRVRTESEICGAALGCAPP